MEKLFAAAALFGFIAVGLVGVFFVPFQIRTSWGAEKFSG